MALFQTKKSILGLDIGSYAVKAIHLDETKSGLMLRAMGVAQLPPGAIVEGNVENAEAIVTAIKSLLKSQKLKVKNVCTSISGYAVIIKKINLPTTTEKELAETIDVEAEQYIPFDISEVNVDFEILGKSQGSQDQMDVVLVAAKKDAINAHIDLLVEAGLVPTVIDVDVFAIQNAFATNYPDVTGTVALIDIGANKLNINVLRDNESLFTRDAPMGGARVTEEIQDRFNVEYEEAEGIKMGSVEAPDPEVADEIVRRAVENWVAETKRAIEFLEASYPDHPLDQIYLSGGSCRFSGLTEYMSQETGVPVTLFNPLAKVGFDLKKFDPAYIEYMTPQLAVCLGLALRMGEQI